MTRTQRRAEQPALPAVVGFQQYARFEHFVPAENQQRFYLLSVQPTLLGDLSLVRTWGRIGTHGQSLSATFPDRQAAQAAVERLVRRRLQRRYELIDWM